jgi:hypothetical protein
MKRLDTWTQPWDRLAERAGSLLPGRFHWEPFGPDGCAGTEGTSRMTVILSVAEEGDEWLHASVARPDRLPSYFDLVALHKALWPEGFAYQVFASEERHVSMHDRALHLWGRADGKNVLPDFGESGTI